MYRRPPGKPGGRVDAGLDGLDRRGSAGLAVRRVLAATRAELRQLHAVGVVAPVLLGAVVALLAPHAGERDLRANIAGLAGHWVVLLACWSGPVCRPPRDWGRDSNPRHHDYEPCAL